MTSPDRPEHLTRGTLGGLSWVYAATAAGATMQLAYTAVMGRLLTPADFGLLAMALVVQRFGAYFAQMGITQALIQKPDLTDEDVRVGLTTSVLLGAAFGLAIMAVAPLAGLYFDTDAVVSIVRVLAVTFFLDSLGRVALSLLRRRMRFRALGIIEVVTRAIAFLGVGIGMAAFGFGVWSLVGAQLAQSTLFALLAYASERHSVRPLLAWKRARVLYGYGARVSVISFLEFIGSSLDALVIGRYTDARQLGQYNRAFLLVNLPFEQVVTGLTRVLFPAFSRIQTETARLRGAYQTSLGLIAAFLVPAAAGLTIAAPELVAVVIGPQWGPAATVLPPLAVAGALGFLSHLGGVVCDATATLNRKLVLQAAYVVLLGGLLLAATRQEQLAVYALAVLAAELVRHVLYMALMRRVLGFGFVGHLRVYAPTLATALIVAAGIAGVTALLRPTAPVLVVFCAQVAMGTAVLVGSLLWGPLVAVRRDAHIRLAAAGLLSPTSKSGRVLRSLLEAGR